MASGSEDGTVRIWDLRTTKNFTQHSFGEGPGYAVHALDIDWSGMYIAAATSDVSYVGACLLRSLVLTVHWVYLQNICYKDVGTLEVVD